MQDIKELLEKLHEESKIEQKRLERVLDIAVKRTESLTEALKSLSDTIVPSEEESVSNVVTELPSDCPYSPEELVLLTEENVFDEVGINYGDSVYIAEVSEDDLGFSNYKGKTFSVLGTDRTDNINPIKLPHGWWCDVGNGAEIYKVVKT